MADGTYERVWDSFLHNNVNSNELSDYRVGTIVEVGTLLKV